MSGRFQVQAWRFFVPAMILALPVSSAVAKYDAVFLKFGDDQRCLAISRSGPTVTVDGKKVPVWTLFKATRVEGQLSYVNYQKEDKTVRIPVAKNSVWRGDDSAQLYARFVVAQGKAQINNALLSNCHGGTPEEFLKSFQANCAVYNNAREVVETSVARFNCHVRFGQDNTEIKENAVNRI